MEAIELADFKRVMQADTRILAEERVREALGLSTEGLVDSLREELTEQLIAPVVDLEVFSLRDQVGDL